MNQISYPRPTQKPVSDWLYVANVRFSRKRTFRVLEMAKSDWQQIVRIEYRSLPQSRRELLASLVELQLSDQ